MLQIVAETLPVVAGNVFPFVVLYLHARFCA